MLAVAVRMQAFKAECGGEFVAAEEFPEANAETPEANAETSEANAETAEANADCRSQ